MSEPTYELLDGGRAIRCRRCGLTSHNPTDVEQRYCGHCKLFHESGVEVLLDPGVPLAPAPNFGASWPGQRERVLARLAQRNPNHPWVREEAIEMSEQPDSIAAIRARWAGQAWICGEDWEGGHCASAGFFMAGAAQGGDDDGPWLLDLQEPSELERTTIERCAQAPDDIKALLARLDAACADAAALRQAIFNYRNVGMRLAAPGSEQWHAILEEAKRVEQALFAAVERPGAGVALLAELEAAKAVAGAVVALIRNQGTIAAVRAAANAYMEHVYPGSSLAERAIQAATEIDQLFGGKADG